MYSTHAPFGTAAVSETCNSIRKCGQTATLNASARCATLSHGVMPPMRAQSTCTIEQAPRSRYSRKCAGWYSDSPTAIGIVAQRRELDVAAEILRRQRLLEPREHQRRECLRAPARLGHGERLVGVDHDLERVADGLAHRGEARDVLRDAGRPTLIFAPRKPCAFATERLVDQLLLRDDAASRPRSCRPGMRALRAAGAASTAASRRGGT